MMTRRYVLWTCVAVAGCFGMGLLIMGNLAGLVLFLPAVPAAVLTVRRMLIERRLRRDLHEWLNTRG